MENRESTRKRVFIVEDEVIIAMELTHHLEALGLEVCGHVTSGDSALQKIPHARPDLVLMDINLGSGLSGIDVAERLRDTDIPILFLTAYSDTELTSRAARTGSFGYIVKPFQVEVLRVNIELALLRHSANRRLLESEQRFRSLFEDAPEGVVRTRIDGTIVDVNPAFVRMVGYDAADELIGENILARYLPGERARLEVENAGQACGQAVEVRWRKRTGEVIVVEISGRRILDAQGRHVNYQAFVRDVSDERARIVREQRLVAHREQLELVLEGTRLGFWDWNPGTSVVSFNERWADMLGYRLDEIVPHIDTLRGLIHPADLPARDEAIRAHVDGLRPYYESTYRIRRKDDTWIYVLDRGRIFGRDHDGHVTRFCGTYTDITVEKHAAQVAIEASRAKTHFLANMSHELRTPLNAILGLSEALLDRTYGDLTANQERSLRTIQHGGRHLHDLIEDVLDIARIEAGKLEITPRTIEVAPLVDECVDLVRDVARARPQPILTDLDPAVTSIHVDHRRLKQVLVNLLSNAVKFGTGGSPITIGTRGRAQLAQVELWVSSGGMGIHADDHDRIFEPFVTLDRGLARREAGAGLGLALVKRLVELHAGTVRVESSPGLGATFVVSLPWLRADDE